MEAFVTGSHAYGEPKESSDIDLVVFLSEEDLSRLENVAKPSDIHYGDMGGMPLRFGKLNLICCLQKPYYDVWKTGTERLKERAPVTREEACRLFQKLRKTAGFCKA